MAKETKVDKKQILKNFKTAYIAKRKWLKAAEEDFEFTLGKQADEKDVSDMDAIGIKLMVINKIRPNIHLLTGLESQNRTDYLAYPEGGEDTIVAEIITRLLKNAMKNCLGDYKISEQFEDGLSCGECFMEPYIDYTYDLLNGEFKLKKLNFKTIFPDPKSEEYDVSDGRYLIKLSQGLTKEELIQIYPHKESDIEKLTDKHKIIDVEDWTGLKEAMGEEAQTKGYDEDESGEDGEEDEGYDLLEYYYKKYVKKYYVLDKKLGTIREASSKEEADNYINIMRQQNPEFEQTAVAIERMIPEIWCAGLLGNEIIDDSKSSTYPRWKTFPYIPFYVYRSSAPIKDTEYKVQGITRGLKDLNFELNKRRTQELRILNSSANSGWISQQGAWVDKDKVKKFGSSPGIDLEYKKGFDKPEKILPTPLSQGHAQLVAEQTQDIKESSGINSDLLAMNERQASGRAIHIRQKQGLVMVQKIYDNLSQTKRILGRFIVSQLGELYTVDTATKICGDQFLNEHFSKPIMRPGIDPKTGQETQLPIIDETTGEMQMELDIEMIANVFNNVLNNSMLGKYDVSVGEGANNETIRYANFMELMEMRAQGVPVPPDVIIEESMISSAHKAKIAQAIKRMEEQMLAQPAKNAGKPQ